MLLSIPRRCLLQAGLTLFVLGAGLWLRLPMSPAVGQATDPAGAFLISVSGHLVDMQNQPVAEADLTVYLDDQETPASHAVSQEDGSFVVDLPAMATDKLHFEIVRAHFEPYTYHVEGEILERLRDGINTRLPDIVLERRVTVGFVFATLCFAGVLALIAFEVLHNTTATLLGASAMLMFSYLGSAVNPDQFYIFDFERAITYIDFDVIFLVMGMMVVVGVLEGTGVFQWLAFVAYRVSRGRMTILAVILMLITAVASALLDNVTTILLIAPISLQIALALDVDPLALIVPEVLAANVGGLSTLIGTPTNILIGSFANLGFNDFLTNLTPGVVLALIALFVYVRWTYRAEYRKIGRGISPTLYTKLEENARIKDPVLLRKSLLVFAGMLLLFVLGDSFHLVPAVTAITGATVLLIWVEQDVGKMLRAVDWTTLMFFIALFVTVGAIQEVGLISLFAEALRGLTGGSQLVSLIILIWAPALISLVIDDIPLTAAMLPIVGFLSRTLAPAGSGVLYYGFAVGAAMGGNGSLIGAAPNLVAAGILDRAGYRISYLRFMRVGAPSMVITIAVGMLWLIFRFFIVPG